MLDNYSIFCKDNISIYYTDDDKPYTTSTLNTMLNGVSMLEEYFKTKNDRNLKAILVPDRDEFDRLVADLLKIKIERPSDPRRIGQAQKTDMVFISPSAYEKCSTYNYIPEDFNRMLIHELVHVFEEFLTPDIETSPLWWGEGLAVYLSDQWRQNTQFRFREPVIEAITTKKIPALEEIENNGSLAYEYGWTIVKFIDESYGKEMILKIVKHLKNGDVFGFLKVNSFEFEIEWKKCLSSSNL